MNFFFIIICFEQKQISTYFRSSNIKTYRNNNEYKVTQQKKNNNNDEENREEFDGHSDHFREKTHKFFIFLNNVMLKTRKVKKIKNKKIKTRKVKKKKN